MKTRPLPLTMAALTLIVAICGHSVAQEPQQETLPESTGVFFKGPSGLVPLRTAPPVQAKARAGILFVPPSTKLRFAGAHASMQLSEPRPTFYVKQMGWDERACALIRLVEGKDAREMPMSTRSLTAKEKYLVPVVTKLLSMNPEPVQYPVFTLTPLEDLEPGEYILAVNSSGSLAYEFGVTGSAPNTEGQSKKKP